MKPAACPSAACFQDSDEETHLSPGEPRAQVQHTLQPGPGRELLDPSGAWGPPRGGLGHQHRHRLSCLDPRSAGLVN